MWRGTLAPRRVWSLVEHLPEDSALAVSIAGGPEHRGWTVQTYLMAQLVNAVRYADANNVRVNGGKLNTDPKPVTGPAVTSKPKRRLDLSKNPLSQPLPEHYRRG